MVARRHDMHASLLFRWRRDAWPLDEALTDTALEWLRFPRAPDVMAVGRPEPDWSKVDRELRRAGVTRALLWQEYRAEHPEGYG